MNTEIKRLQEEIETTKNQERSWSARFVDGFGNLCLSELPFPGKILGLGFKVMSNEMK